MSRNYTMGVQIEGYRHDNLDAVTKAAQEVWPFRDWWDGNGSAHIGASADHQLAGGESEDEFTERLSLAIWKANGAYCEVTVDATYLDELPFESYQLDEDAYERLVTKGANA